MASLEILSRSFIKNTFLKKKKAQRIGSCCYFVSMIPCKFLQIKSNALASLLDKDLTQTPSEEKLERE